MGGGGHYPVAPFTSTSKIKKDHVRNIDGYHSILSGQVLPSAREIQIEDNAASNGVMRKTMDRLSQGLPSVRRNKLM